MKLPLKCSFEYGRSTYGPKKTHLGGCIFSKWPNVKNQFFSKKNFFQIFSNFFLAHPKRNLFLILKWFYFLIFAQNWPICEGFCFSFLKIDFFPLWWGGPPGAPWGVKIFPKMVPMIIIGHIMKVYDEKLAKKNSSVWLYKYSPSSNSKLKFRCDNSNSTKMASSPVSSPTRPRINRAAELRLKNNDNGSGGKSRSGSINSIAPSSSSTTWGNPAKLSRAVILSWWKWFWMK